MPSPKPASHSCLNSSGNSPKASPISLIVFLLFSAKSYNPRAPQSSIVLFILPNVLSLPPSELTILLLVSRRRFSFSSETSFPVRMSVRLDSESAKPEILLKVYPATLPRKSMIFSNTGSSFSRIVPSASNADARMSTAVGRPFSISHLPSGKNSLSTTVFAIFASAPFGSVNFSNALPSSPRDSSSGDQFSSEAHSRIEPQMSRNTVSRLFATFHTD